MTVIDGLGPLTTSQLFALASSATLVYVLAKLTYRLYFHPLARFPGPKIAAATYLYEAWWDIFKSPGGRFVFHLNDLHDRYGPIVRCNPDEIHVRDSDWFETLYAGPGHVRDKWERTNRSNASPGSVASSLGHEQHRARRGALNQLFSRRAIDDLEDKIRGKVQLLVQKLREYANTGTTVDLGAAFTALTTDVITEYCFDQSQNCLEKPDFDSKWKTILKLGFEMIPMGKHFPIVPKTFDALPRSFVFWIMPEFEPFFAVQDAVHGQSSAASQTEADMGPGGQSTKHPSKSNTIYNEILQSKLPPAEKSVTRMADEAFVLVIAGAETTAKVLTVITVHLLQNPNILRRLRTELDPLMSSGSPSSRSLEAVPFFKAVVQEGLRMAEPVTNRSTQIAPDEDLQYHEWVIPRGTPISLTFRDVLYDPKVFDHPNTFDPDRWLRAAQQGVRLDRYMATFGKGARSCMGMHLAISELYLGVASLVTKFDMTLQDFDYNRDLKVVRDLFVGAPSLDSRGVRVEIRNRE